MPTVHAQRVHYNGNTMYAAVMNGRQLLEASFVRRREEDPRRGFQRVLSIPRCKEIARYLDNENLTIPTNIVLSAQSAANLHFSRGRLEWSGRSKSFLVLDGQHRLFAMDYTDRAYELFVAIYDGLTGQQEARLFADINTKQKGVPAALILDIKRMAGTETDDESRLRELFDYIGTERGSPLKGLLSPAAAKRGLISRVTFNSAVKPVLSGRFLGTGRLTQVQERRLVLNYLTAADRTLRASGAQRNSLVTSVVLHAFMELFDEIVQLTMEQTNAVRGEGLTTTMQPLIDLDFDAHTGSNRPARAELVKEMRGFLSGDNTITDDMLG